MSNAATKPEILRKRSVTYSHVVGLGRTRQPCSNTKHKRRYTRNSHRIEHGHHFRGREGPDSGNDSNRTISEPETADQTI